MRSLQPWLVRFVGVSVLSFLVLFVFFNFVGKTNIAWALPWTKPFRLAWPNLPRFGAWTQTGTDGQQETFIQVPTHQLTKTEIAQMYATPGVTNAATVSPAPSQPAR
jgi:hypothetical protein